MSVLYTGVTSQGFSFTTSFVTKYSLLPLNVLLAPPPGGYLTSFRLDPGSDIKPLDAYLTLDNIDFRREHRRVSDSGSTGLLLAFAGGLLLFFKPRKEKAWTS